MSVVAEKDRIYIDESGINEYIYREYGRADIGKEVSGEISGKRFSRESFIAGLYEGKFLAPMDSKGDQKQAAKGPQTFKKLHQNVT